MNVKDTTNPWPKVALRDIGHGCPFKDHKGDLYIRCALSAIVPVVHLDPGFGYAMHVESGVVVSWSLSIEMEPVRAEATILV